MVDPETLVISVMRAGSFEQTIPDEIMGFARGEVKQSEATALQVSPSEN
jgi:hypothetical protein